MQSLELENAQLRLQVAGLKQQLLQTQMALIGVQQNGVAQELADAQARIAALQPQAGPALVAAAADTLEG